MRKINGFTLIETMVSLLLSTIIYLVVLSIIDYSNRSSKDIEKRYNIMRLHSEIKNILSDNNALAYSLCGNRNTIRNSANQVVYRTFDDPEQPGTLYENQSIKITDIKYDTFLIKITYEKVINSFGPKTVTRVIPIFAADSNWGIKLNVPFNQFNSFFGDQKSICDKAEAQGRVSSRLPHTSYRLISCSYIKGGQACTASCGYGQGIGSSARYSTDKFEGLLGVCRK